MAEMLGKHTRLLPPQLPRAVVNRLIKSYWKGALQWSDVTRMLRNAEEALNRLEQTVKDEEANRR